MYKPWMRNPKTTQEARYSQDEDHKNFVRSKRNKKNLPNSYDDIIINSEKNWKSKRRKKFNDKPLKQFEYTFDSWFDMYKLLIYLEDHGIRHKHFENSKYETTYIDVPERVIEKPIYKIDWQKPKAFRSYIAGYETIIIPAKRVKKRKCVKQEYVVRLWHHKDIGLKFIL